MRIVLVGAARPNFVKVAPVLLALEAVGVDVVLVHTGQHYDDAMSGGFFRDLGIREPDHNLGTGSGSHAAQTAAVMTRFEPLLADVHPDAVVVVGDVNSTLACALVAAKLSVPVAHVEAGLRSRDLRMPEEINRMCTDVLSDWLFTPSADADANLRAEGVSADRVFLVGNVMIDTLLRSREAASGSDVLRKLELSDRGYTLVTLHRPSSVDAPEVLAGLVSALVELSEKEPVVFPLHPRTEERLAATGLDRELAQAPGLRLASPLSYLDFLALLDHAHVVITDSGGVQEEATVLGVPCITARDTTERPITVSEGTNTVAGTDPGAILAAHRAAPSERMERRPPLWDGKAAERIARVMTTVPPPLAAFR